VTNNNEILFYKGLEKKFSIFRWALFILIAPVTFELSHYLERASYIVIALALGCVYALFITIAAYSKQGRFEKLLNYTIYFDMMFISFLLIIRGGLRSDLFILYFLLILYNGAKFGFRGTIISLIQSIFLFTVICFVFTPAEEFDLNRYIIRMIHLILMTIVMHEVNHQVDESRIREKVARSMAYKDPLTELPNRLALPEKYESYKQKYEKTGKGFTILLFDVDNFKQVNDSMGHTYGDKVLKTIGHILNTNVSEENFVCRFGGEEFLAFFSEADVQEACAKANKIMEELALHKFKDKPITVSVGVNQFQSDYTMIENISFVDEAMYIAKNTGKNKIVMYKDLGECRSS
jgi:diguanylate cyclase (GGDEF)-like protein